MNPKPWWTCATVGCSHRFAQHEVGILQALGWPRKCLVPGCPCGDAWGGFTVDMRDVSGER